MSYKLKFKMVIIGLFILSRIIRIIFLPLFIGIYVTYYNQWNTILYLVYIVQLLCVLVALIIGFVSWNEIYYSYYIINDETFNNEISINKNLKKSIGYYYDAMSKYTLHQLIEPVFGSDITFIIISFVSGSAQENVYNVKKLWT